MSRGRGETPPPGVAPPKFAPGFGVGRGRGEGASVGFAAGRGRANFSAGSGLLHGPPSGGPIGAPSLADKWDGSQGKSSALLDNQFRYPRGKLLDVYRKIGSTASFANYPDGFMEVQQLSQPEPLEPLAFFAPDLEEEVRTSEYLLGNLPTCFQVLDACIFHCCSFGFLFMQSADDVDRQMCPWGFLIPGHKSTTTVSSLMTLFLARLFWMVSVRET